MGDFLSKLFVDVDQIPHDGFGFVQVLFLGAAYLYVLLIGANMIGDGSELLMLIPSIAGVVGSVVLPVLGAVPDGAIVLFSGLGPREKAETQVSVGVGALAGSTIMLLTVPWFLSVMGGRVPIVGGKPQYGKLRMSLSRSNGQAPRSCGGLLLSQGVSADSSIRTNAVVMLVTCLLCYMVVEIPALVYMHDQAAASDIGPFAWAGVAVCSALFVGYIGLQYYLASANSGVKTTLDQRIVDTMIKTLMKGRLTLRSLSGALGDRPTLAPDADARTPALSTATEEWQKKLHAVLRPFFNRFDTDGNGSLSKVEMHGMLEAVGYHVSQAEFDELFASTDADNSGNIDFTEFSAWISPRLLATSSDGGGPAGSGGSGAFESMEVGASADADGEEEGEDDDDAEEVPEDIRELNLTPQQQRRRVLRRAAWQMGVGTLLVLLFSDPMVDVLDALGNNYLHVPPFFVAFLLGPVASNASEMVASYNYAQKKTRKSISVSFSQLLGAACMNNTFCLLIFYGLIAARGFKWVYHAEVMGIVVVEVLMALVASRSVHTVLSGALVLSLLPMSLVVIVVLKATVFKDVES